MNFHLDRTPKLEIVGKLWWESLTVEFMREKNRWVLIYFLLLIWSFFNNISVAIYFLLYTIIFQFYLTNVIPKQSGDIIGAITEFSG